MKIFTFQCCDKNMLCVVGVFLVFVAVLKYQSIVYVISYSASQDKFP